MPLRVGEVGELEFHARGLGLRHDDLAAEPYRPGQKGGRLIDLHIEGGVAAATIRAGANPSGNPSLAGSDHSVIKSGGRIALPDLPAKEGAVELAQRFAVLAHD